MTHEDPWCVAVDMGLFDLIVLESMHYQTCESYRQVNQHLYKDPLQIKLKSQLRLIIESWVTMDICTASEVKEPDKARDNEP